MGYGYDIFSDLGDLSAEDGVVQGLLLHRDVEMKESVAWVESSRGIVSDDLYDPGKMPI